MKNIRSRLFPMMMILVIALSACNFKANSASAASADATPTPDPASLLPGGYTDLLQQKIASGEWTEGQGLVALLKMFAGETSAKDLGLGAGVHDAEASGLVAMGNDYLQNGDDPAAKAEITRLLAVLFPTTDRLDQYSQPASTGKGGSILAAPVLQTPVDCASLWAAGFPDHRTPTDPCFQTWQSTIGGHDYRIYYPAAYAGDASKQAYYDATRQALLDTLPVYSGFGTMKSIYFVFYTLPHESEADALAGTYGTYANPDSEACPVIIYPHALSFTIPNYEQAIAHELFHCYEGWNLRRQWVGATYNSARWWIEGAASYFSNVVYPTTNWEQDFKEAFANLSTSQPITDLGYENFAFFQFIANVNGGPRGVLALLAAMPTSPGRNAQQAALAAFPGFDLEFEEFAQQVAGNELVDTSTVPIDLPHHYTYIDDISSTDTLTYTAAPFVLARFRLTYAPRLKFANAITITGAPGHEGARFAGTIGAWTPLPAAVSSGCAATAYNYYVVSTASGTDGHKDAVSVTVTGDAPCDQCLVGTWQATTDSAMAYFQSVLSQSGDARVSSITGTMQSEFDDHGRAAGAYQSFSVMYKIPTPDMNGNLNPTDITMTLDGTSGGTYVADGSYLTYTDGVTNIQVSILAYVAGVRFHLPNSTLNYPLSPTSSAHYTCSGDTLTYFPTIEGMTNIQPLVFERMTGP